MKKMLERALLLALLLIMTAGWAQGTSSLGAALDLPDGEKISGNSSDNSTTVMATVMGTMLCVNGTVYEDSNCDGFMNGGEPGLAGWTVRLLGEGGKVLNATTDRHGRYSFAGVPPGNYTVVEEISDCCAQTAPGGRSYDIRIEDKSADRLDFGNYRVCQKDIGSPVPRRYSNALRHVSPDEKLRFSRSFRNGTPVMIGLGAGKNLTSGEHFTLLDHLSYIPEERDQGSCSNSWVWAGTGMMEIALSVQEGIRDRLSIQYLNSNFGEGGSPDGWACCDGTINDFDEFYSISQIAVPWSKAGAHWQDGDRGCEAGETGVPADSISTEPCYHLDHIIAETIPTHGVGTEAAISNIKEVLSQSRAVQFDVFMATEEDWTDFISFWTYQPEVAVWSPNSSCDKLWGEDGAVHSMLCVGYDDTDPENRYWIMLNSWGTAGGMRPRGLLRVGMDMNYDCADSGGSYNLYWSALDIGFSHDNSAPEMPGVPSGPDSGTAGEPYAYTASTTDPDGDQVSYIFSWGDGPVSRTDLLESGVGVETAHVWETPGTYDITVKAVDSKGASSDWSDSLPVMMESPNRPPDTPFNPSGPEWGYSGESYGYSTLATDPDGDALRYKFDWGDGNTTETEFASTGDMIEEYYSWNESGSYSIKVMAEDDRGASSGWSSPLDVTVVPPNRPPDQPSMPSGARSVIVGTPSYYSTSADDPDGDSVAYVLNWGDGTSSDTGFVDSGAEAGEFHSWSLPGTYEVTSVAVDDLEATSATSPPAVIVVANIKTYSIAGTLFNDMDGNGKMDKIEPGMSGWAVQLIKPDGRRINATTGKDGSYKFSDLPAGVYKISEVGKTDWKRTYPGGSGVYTVTLSGANVTGRNFGNKQTRFYVAGVVFNDANGNKKKDTGEAGLSGWTVKLTRPDKTVVKAVTGSSGEYKFSSLAPGTYTLSQSVKSGWKQITPVSPAIYTTKVSDANITGRSFGNKKSTAK